MVFLNLFLIFEVIIILSIFIGIRIRIRHHMIWPVIKTKQNMLSCSSCKALSIQTDRTALWKKFAHSLEWVLKYMLHKM